MSNKSDFILTPKGTTAQRPNTPQTGMLRYNTTVPQYELYNGTAWLMIKKTNGSATWWIVDSNRNAYNPTKKYLQADDPNAESAGSSDYITADFLSNGFKIRNTSTAFNSGNHIYMAFAEQPINYANAR